ncbi:MAG: T9SS type A sorting domain-containing protein [Caldithrix sp.]|nr:T9SS type A sorting domain-containing protein [Caldithrix sp.]
MRKSVILVLSMFLSTSLIWAQVTDTETQWEKNAGEYEFFQNDHLTRGIDLNPVTNHVLVASRTGGHQIYAVDAATGDSLSALDMTDVSGGVYNLNLVAVAEDGVIYACNLTTDGTGFKIYRWAEESSVPTVAFSGDVTGRAGDAFNVVAEGTNTLIYASGSGSSTITVFSTDDGETFTVEKEVSITSGLARGGIAPVADTLNADLWVNGAGNAATLIDADGGVIAETNTGVVPSAFHNIDYMESSNGRKLIALAGGNVESTSPKLQVWDVTNSQANPILFTEGNLTNTFNSNANGTGIAVLSENDLGLLNLYHLLTNNGIAAYQSIPVEYTIQQLQVTTDWEEGPSQYVGQYVKTRGIVTAVGGSGYFLQDGMGEWSGIYVYDSGHDVVRGDSLYVVGTVEEYYGLTELSDVTETAVLASDITLPDPKILNTGEVANEAFESVLIQTSGVCDTAANQYGEWIIDDGSGSQMIDDLLFTFDPTLDFEYDVTGPVYYSYGRFKVEPRDADDVTEYVRDLDVVYADAAADTATADGSMENPFPGIDEACKAAADSATVYVAPGTYGNVYIGSPRPEHLTIMSTDGPKVTTIDGSKQENGWGISFRAGAGWIIDGFTFINVGEGWDSGYACGVYNSNPDTTTMNIVRNCEFYGANKRGVWVQKNTKTDIHNCLFVNTGANAVLSYGFTNFFNNTVVGTDTLSPYGDNSGVYEAGDSQSNGIMMVKNNIFWDNSTAITRAGDSYLYASHNLFFQNGKDTVSVTEDYGGNVFENPLFVDPENNDYTLYAESPAIDAGVEVGLPYEGAAPDMGAYEGFTALMTVYVDDDADPETGDGSEANPFASIDTACQVAPDGATIMVHPGTYGNVYIGSPRPENLTIQSAEGSDETIIDGSLQENGFGIAFRAGTGWIIDGFTFINVGEGWDSGYACGVYNSNPDTTSMNIVRNCKFYDANKRGIWVQKNTKALIHNNVFIRTGANAVLSYGFTDFFNNTVVSTDTLSPYGDNSGIYQAGDNMSNGVMMAQNNIFWDNHAAITRAGDSYLYASHNLFFENGKDTISVTEDYGDNLFEDPMFIDPENDNYQVYGESPVIDAGTDVGLAYEGDAPDLGAYEGFGGLMTMHVVAGADSLTADGTEGHPYPRIDMACQNAVDGATIMVGPGTYGNVYIGTPRPQNLTIESVEGPATTIIDGAKQQNGFGIAFRAGAGWIVDGFKFINIGKDMDSGYACGVYNSNPDTMSMNIVRNCEFYGANKRGIWVQKNTKALIHHNIFVNTGANAVLSYGFTDFFNNTVVGTDTLSPYGDNSGVYEAGDNMSNGVMTVKNNIFHSNSAAITRAGDSYLYSSHNLFFDNERDTLGITEDHGNNLMTDPMFVSVDDDDYRLKEGSPALNAGTDVGLAYTGAAPEMGAYEGEGVTNIEDTNELPTVYALKQNYPNPFNPETTIRYDLPEHANVKLTIFNALGQKVRVLVDHQKAAGQYKVVWDGRDTNGHKVSTGIYFYHIQAGDFQKTLKMLLLK